MSRRVHDAVLSDWCGHNATGEPLTKPQADAIHSICIEARDGRAMLADARVLLKDAMLAGAMLNETLNPLVDWDSRDKANRRKQWQAAEDEIGKFLWTTEGPPESAAPQASSAPRAPH